MHCVQQVTPQIVWVGGNDRRLERFENMFPLPNGVVYNSYVIMDEKTALLDTVDSAISALYLENIEHVLQGRNLDYLVINHMEPDHCANIGELTRRYPDVKIVGNKKTFQFMEQFYTFDKRENYLEVKEGDTINLGKHTLRFIFAPMVHWPEVMFTYEESEGILFSADAFGSFGALSGNIFSDQADFDSAYLAESRRYYANIVGKYGAQVQAVLKKAAALDLRMICPLHGPIWRKDLPYILDKYEHWSKYEPEKKGVVLVYASMYGNTENVMNVIANKLAQKGVCDMRMYDVSKTHPSYIIADVWKYSHLVIGSLENGCDMLARITGTGCMLNVLVASFISTGRILAGAVLATAFLGICGELSLPVKGTGMFRANLLDTIYSLTDEEFSKAIRWTVV
jgi:flavorubredoxin